MKTLQECFEIGVRGVIEQNRPSYDEHIDLCRYRYPGKEASIRCAIGWLITDEAYYDKLEGMSPLMTDMVTALHRSECPTKKQDLDLYCGLQACHDEHVDKEDFIKRFRHDVIEIGKLFDLDVTFIEEL